MLERAAVGHLHDLDYVMHFLFKLLEAPLPSGNRADRGSWESRTQKRVGDYTMPVGGWFLKSREHEEHEVMKGMKKARGTQ